MLTSCEMKQMRLLNKRHSPLPMSVIWATVVVLAFAYGAFASPVERSFRASCDGSEQKYIVIEPETHKVFAGVLVALHGHGFDRHQFVEDGRGECKAAREAAIAHGLVFVSTDCRAKCSWMGPKAEADGRGRCSVPRDGQGVPCGGPCSVQGEEAGNRAVVASR